MTPTDHSHAHVLRLITREDAAVGDQPGIGGWLQRLCRAARRALPAEGVGLSLLSDGDQATIAASGQEIVQLEDLQFALGEGPCLEAYRSRRPVLVPDLTQALGLWPAYSPAVQGFGVSSVFAFPLQVGAARVGALDVYQLRAGDLATGAVMLALTFAEVALQALLDAQGRGEAPASLVDDTSSTHYEVHQAQGMVMVQLEVKAVDALARLRAYAFANSRTLRGVADDVLSRTLKFEQDEP